MWDAIIDAIFGVIPKEQRIILMRMLWVGGVSFHMAWVCGWTVIFGLPAPFAWAADVRKEESVIADLAAKIQADRIERLDQAIQNVRAQQCRTPSDSPAHTNYTAQLNTLHDKYVQIAGKEPHIPRCDET